MIEKCTQLYKELVGKPPVSFRAGKYSANRTTLDILNDLGYRYAFSQVELQDFPVAVTLFLHSFSLLDWVNNPSAPKLDPVKLDKFEKAIAFVSGSKSLSFIKEDELDLVPILSEKDALNTEIRWKSLLRGMYYTYQKAKRISGRNNKAKALVTAVRIFAILLFISLVLLLANVFIG